MSHTINQQYIHFLWPTKNLTTVLSKNLETGLMSYIGGIVKHKKGSLIAGVTSSNHLHLLIHAPLDVSLSEMASRIKTQSTKWYRQTDPNSSTFCWETAYSAFSVSPSSIPNVRQYFLDETQRHSKTKYEDELMGFLKMQEVEYQDQYLTTSSHTRLIYHIVWGVKNRVQSLQASIQQPLHQCLKVESLKCGGQVYAIGNVEDHVHVLLDIPAKVSVSTVVQNLKTASTHLINSLRPGGPQFFWQEGFGAFSVGKPSLQTVKDYVNNQEEHHKVHTFELEWHRFCHPDE